MIDNFIFDLDGTIADSANDIISHIQSCYKMITGKKDLVIKTEYIGPPFKEIVKQAKPNISEDILDKMLKEYRTSYDSSDYPGTFLYKNVLKILDLLKSNGKQMFMVTNKPSLPSKRILNKFKLEHFTDVISPDSVVGKTLNKTEMLEYLIKKHDLDKRHTVMVGDAPSDIAAAKSNDIMSVALLSGYGNKEQLLALKPDYAYDNFSQLKSLIK